MPRKGFDTVIEALTTVPAAELVIVGGPERAELDTVPEACRLRKLATDLGVADRVSLYGSVAREDMPALLRSADVVTCTPWYEPFGIVPLEAMACGVPVVASAVGGMLDTVVHDLTGLLIPPKDPRACANAVTAILRDRRGRPRSAPPAGNGPARGTPGSASPPTRCGSMTGCCRCERRSAPRHGRRGRTDPDAVAAPGASEEH